VTAVEDRLDAVQRQLNALQREVDELRALAGATVEDEPAAFVNPDPSIFEVVTKPEPDAVPAWTPPPWPPPQQAKPRPAKTRERSRNLTLPTIETADLMGARSLAIAGGIVMLLGVVLLFVLAVNRGWIGPEERVLFGAAVSVAAVGLGFLVRSRYGQFHAALAAVGAGIAGGYATLLAAVVMYDLVPQPMALVIAAGIAAVGVAIALLWDAQIVAALGLVGATLAPGAVALDSGITAAGTGFAAFVFAGTAVVALARGWRPLLVAGVIASLPQAVALVASEPDRVAGPLAVSLAFAALYLGAGLAVQLRSAHGRLDRLAGGLVLLSAVLSLLASGVLLGGGRETTAFLVVAAVYTALAVGLFRRDRELAAVLAVPALTLIAVGVASALEGPALVVVWAAEAAGLAWLAGQVRDLRYAGAAFAYLALAALHALVLDTPPDHLYQDVISPADGIAAPIAVLVALLAMAAGARTWRDAAGDGMLERQLAALARHRDAIAAGLVWAAGVLAAYAAALGIVELVDDYGWAHVGVVALWAVAGAAMLVAGALLERVELRLGGAIWLGVVTVHLLWFALPTLEQPQRGWAALAVAVPVLLAAYVAGLVDRRSPEAPVGVVLSGALGAVAAVVLAPAGHATGYSLLGAAAAYLVLAAPVLPRRRLSTPLWAVGLVFGLASAAVLLTGTWLVAALAGAAAALAALAAFTGEGRFQVPSLTYLALALGYVLVDVAPPADLFAVNAHPAEGAPAAFLAAAAALVVALLARADRLRQEDGFDAGLRELQPPLRTGAAWATGVTALYGLSLTVMGAVAWLGDADVDTEFQRGHTTVSAVWGIVGLVVLYLGLRRGWRSLRSAGFVLFGVALAKIFLYDLSQLSSIARAVSFLAVGALLLTAGFFYQRLSRTT
jgi:uncharacterized membrane protein